MTDIIKIIGGAVLGAILKWLYDEYLLKRKRKEDLLNKIYAPLNNIFETETLIDANHEKPLFDLAMAQINKEKLPLSVRLNKKKSSEYAKNKIAPILTNSGLPLQGKILCEEGTYAKVKEIIGNNLDICDDELKGMYSNMTFYLEMKRIWPGIVSQMLELPAFNEQVRNKDIAVSELIKTGTQDALAEANTYLYRIYNRSKEIYHQLRNELGFSSSKK